MENRLSSGFEGRELAASELTQILLLDGSDEAEHDSDPKCETAQ